MVLSFFDGNNLISAKLPEKISGQYWVTDIDKKGNDYKIISIEASNNKWFLKSNRLVKVLDDSNNPTNSVVLENDCFYKLFFVKDHSTKYLYAQNNNKDFNMFTKYAVKNKAEFIIGRDIKSDIKINNDSVSSVHACLKFDGIDTWKIVDNNSRNGTYVNNKKISNETTLVIGDVVYILGIRIIIGNVFFAINNPNGMVQLNSKELILFKPQKINHTEDKIFEEEEISYYYRSPQFSEKLELFNLVIDPPPAKTQIDDTPLALTIGPSLTMGLASMFTAVASIINLASSENPNWISAMPTIAMAIGMLLGTVLWPIITKSRDNKRKLKSENDRKNKYINYLEGIRQIIKAECKHQMNILHENYPSTLDVIGNKEFWDKKLWSRTVNQEEFLKLRLGIGNIPMFCDINYPEKHFSVEEDVLLNELYKVTEEQEMLVNVPINLDLKKDLMCGIVGNDRKNVLACVNNIILQLVLFHSYDEVKIIVIYNKNEEAQFHYAKLLPHIWDNDKTIRFAASNEDEVRELSTYIKKEIEHRESDNEKKDENINIPHYVIIDASKELSSKAEFISTLIEKNFSCGFSMISVCDEIKNLRKECSTVLQVEKNTSYFYNKYDLNNSKQALKVETICNEARDVSQELANINLSLNGNGFVLPSMLTFLDMFEVSKIEHLNIRERWRENNPVSTLKTPVGVDTNGDTFYLDLHEKFHGPHGLVAGMTGSGKSEFIITFILSLAVNFHPDEVAFILIDYKGGGLTGAFESDNFKLPHLAGSITNLDGASVKRSLISIQAELRRRQAIFNDARKIANEGTMDIYKYQQLYRNGVVNEPVPHLFIISDEFAELKAQQPEFMEQLISAARIGRSLGVHLILATQKPSGVVDDQIWSNTRFRVCLKVQDKSDSMDMIKRPDAAEIAQTGRFYLQVGFNELFELGQSAWCGAAYQAKEDVNIAVDNNIEIFDNMGKPLMTIKTEDKKVASNVSELKQIVEINRYIFEMSNEDKIKARPLWLDPIPSKIFEDELEKKYNYKVEDQFDLNAVVGEYDDPTNQLQALLKLSISKNGNTIIYGSTGMGKTTLLTCLLYSLIKHYDSEHLNLYVLDFASETLKAFEKAPQICDVLTISDEEKITNMMKIIGKEIQNRKKLFADYGGDFCSYIKNSGKALPNIIVVINNYSAFSEVFENLEDDLSVYTRDGIKYGIYFILTASVTNAVKYRMQQNFNQLFSLQQNDINEYSAVLGNVAGVYPSAYKGRGIFKEEDIYEFQTAYVCENIDNRFDYIKDYCAKLCENSKTKLASPIPVLPEKVDSEYFGNSDTLVNISRIPIGVNYNSLNIENISLKARYITLVSALDSDSYSEFMEGVSEIVSSIDDVETVVLDPEELFGYSQDADYNYVTSADEYIKQLFDVVVERHNAYKSNKGILPDDFDMHRIVIIINSLTALYNKLDAERKEELELIFEKGHEALNISIIVSEPNSGVGSYKSKDWYKNNCLTSGIWIGDGIIDQYVYTLNKRNSDYFKEIESDYGFVVNKGRAVLAKIIQSKYKEQR